MPGGRFELQLRWLLRSRWHRSQKRLFEKLKRLNVEALETRLVEALSDRRPRARWNAAWALCRLDPARAVEPIVTTLRKQRGHSQEMPYEPPDAQELFDLGLAGCDCDGLGRLEVFSAALADGDKDVHLRAIAAFMLGNLPDPRRAVETLATAAASDPSPAVRTAAAKGLKQATRDGPRGQDN